MTSPLIEQDALLRRIEAIERWQREFAPSIAKSFGTTVAALTATVAELEAVVDALVMPVGGKATASSGTVDGWSGGMATRLTVNLSRPSGYTGAVVVGTGAMGVVSNAPGVAIARVTIEGSSGYSTVLPTFRSYGGADDFSSGTVANTRSLSGLSGNIAVTLDVDMTGISHTSEPTMDPYQGAQLTAIAIFTK